MEGMRVWSPQLLFLFFFFLSSPEDTTTANETSLSSTDSIFKSGTSLFVLESREIVIGAERGGACMDWSGFSVDIVKLLCWRWWGQFSALVCWKDFQKAGLSSSRRTKSNRLLITIRWRKSTTLVVQVVNTSFKGDLVIWARGHLARSGKDTSGLWGLY